MAIKLVYNWRDGWKFISVQANTLVLALIGAWGAMPAKFQDAIPITWVLSIAGLLLVGGTVGRFVQQSSPATERAQDASPTAARAEGLNNEQH